MITGINNCQLPDYEVSTITRKKLNKPNKKFW